MVPGVRGARSIATTRAERAKRDSAERARYCSAILYSKVSNGFSAVKSIESIKSSTEHRAQCNFPIDSHYRLRRRGRGYSELTVQYTQYYTTQ
jgi:hypothetical protein